LKCLFRLFLELLELLVEADCKYSFISRSISLNVTLRFTVEALDRYELGVDLGADLIELADLADLALAGVRTASVSGSRYGNERFDLDDREDAGVPNP
jgi:hypothetical protein